MPPISNLHITKDLPLGQSHPNLQELFRMVDVIGTFSLTKKKSAKHLPRPGLSDITQTISNMKYVVDNQQLKIQKNMIQIQRQQQMIMSTQKQQQQQYHNDKQARFNRYNNIDHSNGITKRLFNNNNNNTSLISTHENLQSSTSYYPQSSYHMDQQQQQLQQEQQDDYEKIQIQSKEQFFGDDQIDYFTPCNPDREIFINDDDDDLEDVKKYLVFDF